MHTPNTTPAQTPATQNTKGGKRRHVNAQDVATTAPAPEQVENTAPAAELAPAPEQESTTENTAPATTENTAPAPATQKPGVLPPKGCSGHTWTLHTTGSRELKRGGLPGLAAGTVGAALLAHIAAGNATLASAQAAVKVVDVKGAHPVGPLMLFLSKNSGCSFSSVENVWEGGVVSAPESQAQDAAAPAPAAE
jgi:hypothetical protein